MHLLPARTKTTKNKIEINNELKHFYLSLFSILVLFFSAFYLKIHLNKNTNTVLGSKTDISKEILFWQNFTQKNPQYYEAWVELYDLTGEYTYLNKAVEIDPNR